MDKFFTKTRRVWHGVVRRYYRLFRLHPLSHPYLSGDNFRAIAQHVHDMDQSIDPMTVHDNDILFVQAPRLQNFFEFIFPSINAQFILISHNGDQNITEDYLPYLTTNNIKHWFAQNCLLPHPKITPLPIGLENKWYCLHGIPQYFNKLRRLGAKKDFRILYKFSVSTNLKERTAALEALKSHPLATTYTDWRESLNYLSTLNQFAFVASPAGNGEDCHRTWEAMYLGVIPILKRNHMSESFAALNLPVLLIDDWFDLQYLDEAKLTSHYKTLERRFSSVALWSDHWVQKIKTEQHA